MGLIDVPQRVGHDIYLKMQKLSMDNAEIVRRARRKVYNGHIFLPVGKEGKIVEPVHVISVGLPPYLMSISSSDTRKALAIILEKVKADPEPVIEESEKSYEPYL